MDRQTEDGCNTLTNKTNRGQLIHNMWRIWKSSLPGIVLFAGLAFVTTFASTRPALADLKICNETRSLVGVAIGYRENGEWLTEGWWRIPASACASVIEGNLASRYYYAHAEEAESSGRWRGPVFMCTSNKQFRIRGIQDCFARGYERTGFFEIDTGDQRNWQIRLTQTNRSETRSQ